MLVVYKHSKMSDDGKALAEIVKDVHRRLRKEFRKSGDPESVWLKHCQNETTLKQYATAMHHLATEHWEKLRASNPVTSRINWTWSFLLSYYFEGGLEKERLKSKLSAEWPEKAFQESKIRVLDVGSCYNPFQEFEELDVLPIDLCPALDSVYQCDFLTVSIGEKTITKDQHVSSLSANSFQCIVFSFLLEYLPSSCQRWACCVKAQQLLQDEGLLIIITPDSKAAHSNSKVMASWREALAAIGLKRIKYEKLQHAHCMAFRKISIDERLTPCHPSASDNQQYLASMMYIPQDFHNVDDSEHEDIRKENLHFTEEELIEGFTELPMFDDE